jgi:hypothetical protein
MLSASFHHPEIAVTPTMTVEVIAGFQKGGPVPAGEKTLWTAWSRFRPAAHFHALRQLWTQTFEPEFFIDWRTQDFDEYLAAAEFMRKQAVASSCPGIGIFPARSA